MSKNSGKVNNTIEGNNRNFEVETNQRKDKRYDELEQRY